MCDITSKLAKCNYKTVAEMVFLTVTTLFNFIHVEGPQILGYLGYTLDFM